MTLTTVYTGLVNCWVRWHFSIHVLKQTALLNVHVLFSCLYMIYILIILQISILRYFQNIISISYPNWNPDIESSLVTDRDSAVDHGSFTWPY